ncbi:DUF3288 family protein [Candidatus Atelocyanobacterium thalassae]|uniref:DUF3288 family protein n=2 Tax=Candidatus Atelocyanobacterium thalassae TaxID=713887 RepID=A0A086CID6_9CHRO|nr:DUF3288 family protein [Candidatus Atelocyanobacterium thalassa]KFF41950.1 MAG: Protein of unknown function (DUF3288) [Candidatus Atelocyanobacterium thalassa isolate SIO64986]BDA39769.1 hypothetical protein CPARK_000060900 [cyanobacterium endosymbiont of Braarudosphaera bigelowii]
MLQDQTHPQEHRDRLIVNDLLNSQPDDYKLAELARLLIRYQNFPGARKVYQDLNKILISWNLTQEKLFIKTRELHYNRSLYSNSLDEGVQDWT